jgi:thymidylate kinase
MKPIIIEGGNATGKTRLANSLALELSKRGWKYRTNKLPRARSVEDQFRLYDLIETLLSNNVPIIFDRIPFISDLVYPLRYSLHIPIIEIAQKFISNYKPIIIYCKIPPEAAYTNYTNRALNKEDFSFAVYDLYDRIMAHFPNVIQYNYFRMTENEMASHIEAEIIARQLTD